MVESGCDSCRRRRCSGRRRARDGEVDPDPGSIGSGTGTPAWRGCLLPKHLLQPCTNAGLQPGMVQAEVFTELDHHHFGCAAEIGLLQAPQGARVRFCRHSLVEIGG